MRVFWGRCGLKRANLRILRNRAVMGEVLGSGGSGENRRFGEIVTLTVLFVVILSVATGVSCDGKGARTSSGAGYAGNSQKISSGYEDGVSSDRSVYPLDNTGQIQAEIAIPLDDVINEIESFADTGVDGTADEPSVDPQVLEMLKAELVKKLTEMYGDISRVVSRPPEGSSGAVTDLAFDFESNMLSWTYVNRGDYDLSGEVGVSDITAIAQYYLANTTDGIGDDALEAWIDGNGNGEVGISDITTIAENYLCTVAGYRIVTRPDTGGWFSAIGDPVPYSAKGSFPPVLSAALPDEHERYISVLPVDSTGEGGEVSNVVEYPQPPKIVSVSPTVVKVNQSTLFNVDVEGTGPFVYEWTFSYGIEPREYTDATPGITATIIGAFSGRVKVSNAVGFDEEWFSYDVLEIIAPPEVKWIYPLQCEDGVDVDISATVTGTYPLTYYWNFGGGAEPNETTTESAVVHISTGSVGVYNGTLTVTNKFGTDTEDFILTIVDALIEPVIYSITPDGGYANEPIQFYADAGGSDVKRFAWDFKGGASPPISTEANPLVVLGAPGEYPMSLTVTNDAGKATREMTLVVTDPTAPPVIRSVSPSIHTSGSTTTFIADVRGKPPITYWWDFGGGAIPNTTNEESPTVTMRSAGDYNCALTVENEFGITTYQWKVTVDPTWHRLDIETEVGCDYPSLTLDSNELPHFAYYDNNNGNLEYAYLSGSTLIKYELDTDGDVGLHTSLALDSNDSPQIAYYDLTNKNLKYAWHNGSIWKIETVDSLDAVGQYASIAVDSQDRPHISYFDATNGDLKYAFYENPVWTVETLDSENVVGKGTAIAVDSYDRIHIAYTDFTNRDLKYALFDAGSWAISVLDSDREPGMCPAITLDKNNNPHISHYDDLGEYEMRYTYFTGSAWVNTVVDGNQPGSWWYGGETSIDVDSEGYPYLLYYDYWNWSMKLAYYGNSKWNYVYPLIDSEDFISGRVSATDYEIRIDSHNNIHMCFYDGQHGGFIYYWYG